ncbi:MAG: hypothetical protein DRI44_08905 [Chlamydiae bacterium]|nr:MAG: hypothetical protein DRI44_08905 [Chlamydiota bacterium]
MKKKLFTCAIALILSLSAISAFASIAGSTLTATTKYTPGVTNTLAYDCYNANDYSVDYEYIYTVAIQYISNMNVLSGLKGYGNESPLNYNGAVGEAALAKWDSDESAGTGYGAISGGGHGYFTNEVAIDSSITGSVVLTYYLVGDYGFGITNTLIIKDVNDFVSNPPTAITEVAAPVTWDFAILRGISNPNELDTTVYFEYGLDTSYGSVSPMYTIFDGNTDVHVPVTTSELTPGSTYHYRFIAYNVAGTNYGSDMVFTTSVSPVRTPSMFFQPLNIYSGVAACQLDSTQPFDARAADDFMYSSSTDYIYQVRWWLAEWNGTPPYVTPSAFNIYLYTNYAGGSGCYPTNVIKSWNIPIAQCNEQLFDADTGTYSYWAELSPKYKPQPGVHYWLTIQPVVDFPPQAGLKLAATTGNLCPAMQVFPLAGLPDWTPLSSGSDIAYVIYPNPVPEPAVFIVLLTGLLLLIKKR